ncbi:MAG: FAD-binding oxidoreductase [Pseudohaliea sp.]
MASADRLPSLRRRLAEAGLEDRLVLDGETLALFASDLVFPGQRRPLAVLRPRSVEDVAALLECSTPLGLNVEVRGGGLSYSGGYLPQDDHSVVLDMSGLGGITWHPGSDNVVCVEAGVTWLALDDWLAGTGRRPALQAPISGSLSTIAGSIRQGMPTDMSAVKAVEIVTPRGQWLRTGALATDSRFSPLWRGQGPDLTGLFLGDCGAFGVLTRAWISLEAEPEQRRYFSCALPSPEAFPALLAAVGAPPGNMKAYCLDAGRRRALRAQPPREQFSVALRLLAGQRGVLPRLSSAVDLLRTLRGGTAAAPSATWAAHVCLEGHDRATVEALLQRAWRYARRAQLVPLETTVAKAMTTRPYSVRGVLGPDYERWAPVSAVFDLSRLDSVIERVTATLDELCRAGGDDGVQHSMLMMGTGGDHIVLEPMLLWPSALYPLHRKLVPRAKDVPLLTAPERDARVRDMRQQLASLLDALGGQHVQLGRFYDYRSRLSGPQLALLEALKLQLDPEGRLARGMLGLGGPALPGR